MRENLENKESIKNKKESINVTELSEYLFCPRKTYLKRIKKIKEPFTKSMCIGFLRHKILDIFGKTEKQILTSIKEPLSKHQILEIYQKVLRQIVTKEFINSNRLILKFNIDRNEFYSNFVNYMKKELSIRTHSAFQAISKGFLGEELWKNIKPKYSTELKLESENLGLRGRIDRIEFSEDIIPYEVKSRDSIFPADKIQLAAYSLLLEEKFNKRVEKGYIETLNTKEEISITQDLKQQVLEYIEKIRNMKEPPAFPNNFNKCRSCNLRQECVNL